MTTTTSRPVMPQIDLDGPSTTYWVASTARMLMQHHGLGPEWKFDWDNAKRRFGYCKYATKRISMSFYLSPHRTRADNLNTMLHEIAHALVGPGHHHDATWRAMARRLGAIPQACGGSLPDAAPKAPWALWCAHCDKKVAERHRRTEMTGRYHRECGIRPGRLLWRVNK